MKARFSAVIAIVLLVAFSLPAAGNLDVVRAASVCNAGQFVADVTIPDGTYINAGATFRIAPAGSLQISADLFNDGVFENEGTLSVP